MALNCGTGSITLKALVKRVREAPHSPSREFLVLRLEIEAVNFRKQASGNFRLAIDERRVEDQPSRVIGDLRPSPQFNLPLERLEVPLNPVHSNRERIDQVETLGVFGKHRCEIA